MQVVTQSTLRLYWYGSEPSGALFITLVKTGLLSSIFRKKREVKGLTLSGSLDRYDSGSYSFIITGSDSALPNC